MTIDISNVTSHGPHIGSYRTTRYEERACWVGPNSFGVEAVERATGVNVRVEVPESLYTPEQIAIMHAAMSLREAGVAIVHGAKEDALKLAGIDIPREEVAKLVAAADEAKAAQAAAEEAKRKAEEEADRLRDEAIVEAKRIEIARQAAEEELAAKRAEVAQLRAEHAALAKGKPAP